MRITTLEYIHTLLKEQEANKREIYRTARNLQHDLEEDAENREDAALRIAAKELVAKQKAAADQAMERHNVALDALQDFESQDWR